jgi:hypothetical protein
VVSLDSHANLQLRVAVKGGGAAFTATNYREQA